MYCRTCGKVMNDDAVFCKECGARQITEIVQMQPVYQQPQIIYPAQYVPAPRKHTARNVVLFIIAVILGFGVFRPMLNGAIKASVNSTAQTTAFVSKYEYETQCKEVAYDDLCRNPSLYTGDKIKITGEISQYISGGTFKEEAFSLYEDYDIRSGDSFLKKRWYVSFSQPSSGRILEDDIVIFYGTFTGMQDLKTVLGAGVQAPQLKAEYFERVPQDKTKTTIKN